MYVCMLYVLNLLTTPAEHLTLYALVCCITPPAPLSTLAHSLDPMKGKGEEKAPYVFHEGSH